MSITVKVIFLGLIGFVPSPEGRDDVAALLVNPGGAQSYETQCNVPHHYPTVLLLRGKCEGDDCYRTDMTRCQELFVGRDDGLEWCLHEEKLDISGDERNELDFQNPNFLANLFQGAAPGGPKQASYFSWVPDMDKLTSEHGQLSDECLSAGPDCPLHAQFLIEGGEISTCHMIHDDVEKTTDGKRNVRIFNYVTTDGKNFRRAVADAVQVIFHGNGDRVRLRAEKLRDRRPPHYSEVWLRPEHGDDTVTLIVANLPLKSDRIAHSHEDYARPHSDVFFYLLEDREGPRSVRILSEKVRRVNPGSCEREIDDLDKLAESKTALFDVPHAVTACDGTRFPKP